MSWHIFNTHHVDQIQVDQRGIDSASAAANRRFNASSNSSHTVTLLSPGTTYEFYVQISSYGKTDRTDTETVTTGAAAMGCYCLGTVCFVYNSVRVIRDMSP